MEDSGIVDERGPVRGSPPLPQYVRTGWEGVVFVIEEIGSEEASCVCDESVPPRDGG